MLSLNTWKLSRYFLIASKQTKAQYLTQCVQALPSTLFLLSYRKLL
jgi:hypothetical protein